MTPLAVVLIAIGGALLFEGVAWAIFPGGIRSIYQRMLSELGDRDLHISGLISVFVGVALIVWGLSLTGG